MTWRPPPRRSAHEDCRTGSPTVWRWAASNGERRSRARLDHRWLPRRAARPHGWHGDAVAGDARRLYRALRRRRFWLRLGRLAFIVEGSIIEIDRGEAVLLAPVILGVLPLDLLAALREQVHAAHHVAGV